MRTRNMGKTIETIKALEEFADEQIEHKKKAQRELDDLKYILNACLRAMPCGYIPNHTIENLPAMIEDQAQRLTQECAYNELLEKQRDILADALEKIAAYESWSMPDLYSQPCCDQMIDEINAIAKSALAAKKG